VIEVAVVLFLATVSPDGTVEAKALPQRSREACIASAEAFRRRMFDFGLSATAGTRYSRCIPLAAEGRAA
jgi:hypothetical protein